MNRLSVNRLFFVSAFVLGLLSVVWIGAGFVGSSGLALAMTALIGGVYLMGAQEIRRYRQASAALSQALAQVPQPLAALEDWLSSVPPPLRDAVRQRIESERGALPGLALTPYLIGLLVMLGMLGTFLGMVLTFKGVVFTLEGSADLQAIRSALAAPIKGLGLAFGTSVVGVATSAMLGLMSAIARRERAEAARQLDARVATVFRPFSLAHQRQATVDALQQQASALPAVADRLQALMERIEQRSQQLDEQLLARQAQFLSASGDAYGGLARSVEQSLRHSLDASARAAGEGLQAAVDKAMNALTQEATRQHERVDALVRTQLQGLDQALVAFTTTFEQRSGALLAQVQDTLGRSQAEHSAAERERQAAWAAALQDTAAALQDEWRRLGAQTLAQQQAVAQTLQDTATRWREELAGLRGEEAARGEAAVQRLGELQASLNQQLSTQLASLALALEAPMARLIETAAEAPRAAAEVIARLRQDMSQLTERDNSALQERATLMQHIDALLQSVQQATAEQRAAIESLVGSAGAVLDRVGRQFADTVGAQAVRADEVAAQVGASAIELASLGEAFNHGVALFSRSQEALIDSLQRVEGAVTQSVARSDEQLAYYVAQAREVIDLSISSQQGIVEDLRRLRAPPGGTAA
ncbi:hypothetical protein SOM08_20835 [Hydrogenophaga sp. SNF1]|uniref:hypothetical protein n=1 Tax=Hydrogenophaga sp. SNF1 TaxID=3098762 RepID=UPI002ACBE9FC|nr:hypothetical protein [Hydrogenophaga sp. SNF1]WQB83413.1 hypothetical protein SOM08_20835 [Hydrogenophaga sp. SNF1]